MTGSAPAPLPSSARQLARSLRSRIARLLRPAPPKVDSAAYWEERYRAGLTSGTGSYGRLAEFKAEFLNAFVAEHEVGSIIEFGSGDGAQLELAQYPTYVGVDVAETAIQECRAKFTDKPNYRFCKADEFDPSSRAELTLSLDVIYHLVEDEVFEAYMHQLFDASTRFVIIYSSNTDDEVAAAHVRRRLFTDWVSRNRRDFDLIQTVPNRYPFDPADPENTSQANFYVYRFGQSGR